MFTTDERAALMVEAYGEVCTRAKAAKLLSRSPNTIPGMVKDGRLDEACEGTMIDVRSIARYISNPKQEDEDARIRRLKLKHNSEFAI